jgi:hypothetical protein
MKKDCKGLIDACPVLNTDGKMYLFHGFTGIPAGMKSETGIFKMTPDRTNLLIEIRLVYKIIFCNQVLDRSTF